MPTFRDIVFTISTVSDISGGLPLISWVVFAKKKTPYTIMGVFFVIYFVLKSYTLVTAEMHRNNMPAFHLLALAEILAVYCFYCRLVYNRIFNWGVVIIVCFHIANAIFYQKVNTFNSLTWTIDMILIITIGLFYIMELYKNENDYTPLEERPDFIITVGWLLYAAGSLFTYLMGTEILSGYAGGFFKNGWFFQTISTISKDVIICYGFWLTKKK